MESSYPKPWSHRRRRHRAEGKPTVPTCPCGATPLVMLTRMLSQPLEQGQALTDAALESLLPPVTQYPVSIHQAMRHSVFAGGKRLRPILCMESGRLFDADEAVLLRLASALELIHTYSLIHDDLPALANDDLRRGKPTCHAVYGEATAILAGD